MGPYARTDGTVPSSAVDREQLQLALLEINQVTDVLLSKMPISELGFPRTADDSEVNVYAPREPGMFAIETPYVFKKHLMFFKRHPYVFTFSCVTHISCS